MRWSYKTVHYELQKEGLLGNAFLDESEIEKSLNEYGMAGWELVTILETMDGLIAVLKQSLGQEREEYPPSPEETAVREKIWPAAVNKDRSRTPAQKNRETAARPAEEVTGDKEDLDYVKKPKEPTGDECTDVGYIRIE